MVVGWSQDTGNSHLLATRWSNDTTPQGLGTLGGVMSQAMAVNNTGDVVGWSLTAANEVHAFLWQNGTLTDLNDMLPSGSGWVLGTAYALNNTGVIVGDGTFNGEARAFRLTITQEDNCGHDGARHRVGARVAGHAVAAKQPDGPGDVDRERQRRLGRRAVLQPGRPGEHRSASWRHGADRADDGAAPRVEVERRRAPVYADRAVHGRDGQPVDGDGDGQGAEERQRQVAPADSTFQSREPITRLEVRTVRVRRRMNKVVARHADGTVVKGTSMNVDVTKPTIHVRTSDGKMAEVRLADLKALFFVKSLEGDPAHNEAMAAAPADPRARGSHLIEMRFRDGERLVAFANRFPPAGAFFFVVPVDSASNNVRILVNRAELRSIEKATEAA